AFFIGKTGKIGIGKIRFSVNGNRKNILAFIKYLLMSVPMVIIDVENGHFAVFGKKICSNRGIVEIAKTAKYVAFGMVPGRTDQSIRGVIPFQQQFGAG